MVPLFGFSLTVGCWHFQIDTIVINTLSPLQLVESHAVSWQGCMLFQLRLEPAVVITAVVTVLLKPKNMDTIISLHACFERECIMRRAVGGALSAILQRSL